MLCASTNKVHKVYACPVVAEVSTDTRREVENHKSLATTLADVVSKLMANVGTLHSGSRFVSRKGRSGSRIHLHSLI